MAPLVLETSRIQLYFIIYRPNAFVSVTSASQNPPDAQETIREENHPGYGQYVDCWPRVLAAVQLFDGKPARGVCAAAKLLRFQAQNFRIYFSARFRGEEKTGRDNNSVSHGVFGGPLTLADSFGY